MFRECARGRHAPCSTGARAGRSPTRVTRTELLPPGKLQLVQPVKVTETIPRLPMTNPKSGGLLNALRGMGRASALTLLACTLFSSVSVAAAPASGPELQKWRRVDRFDV